MFTKLNDRLIRHPYSDYGSHLTRPKFLPEDRVSTLGCSRSVLEFCLTIRRSHYLITLCVLV